MKRRKPGPRTATPPRRSRAPRAGGDVTQPDRQPPYRRLRGYAFDPGRSTRVDTMRVNEVVFRVPWEAGLLPGPVGEYLEIVDHDPGSGCFYPPVHLDDPLLLAQDGLPPSEGNPQFHQQMVYAVAMTTIRNFERALGRRALWAERKAPDARSSDDRFVRRLRIYPHALREANAYYSPDKKALLFGYFPSDPVDVRSQFPGGTVFTCLSHDIVAHETTHALLDGFHRSYIEPTNPDALAFHEAFADIVALFQHFSFPEVVAHQVARQRGDLASQGMLGELAHEFGLATGSRGALRDALGAYVGGKWKPHDPDPNDYETVLEPHARGAILVGAVFDAFLTIYRTRIADLLRLATNGTGVLPEGALHPDLVARLSVEAAKSAQHVLTMCIRALDYCPPVDLTFGEYLRALVSADCDLVPDDDRRYRVAFIEAFQRRGIYPRNVRSLSVDSLRWQQLVDPRASSGYFWQLERPLRDFVHRAQRRRSDRAEIFRNTRGICQALHAAIERHGPARRREFEETTGLALTADRLPNALRLDDHGPPKFEVRSCRPARRAGPDGDLLNQVVVTIVQRRHVRIDPGMPATDDNLFWFRGGCTVMLDLETLELQYVIRKRITSEDRLERQRRYLSEGTGLSLRATYFRNSRQDARREPFAFLHRS